MKNIYKMTIAAVLAATMGASMATTVPGVSGDIFEFNGSSTLTGGTEAFTNIGTILSAVHTEGEGSDINQSNFWNSFISESKVEVFYYDQAADFIEELIYLVDGTASADPSVGVSSYQDASDFTVLIDLDGNGTKSWTDYSEVLSSADTANGGKGYDGSGKRLKITGQNAITLLATLGFTLGGATLDSSILDGAATYSTVDGTMVMPFDADSIAASTASTANVDAVDSVLGSDAGVAFKNKVSAASLDEGNFVQANTLIGLIADQLRNGYILDTANAALAIESIIGQHNAFLGASIVDSAKDIKLVVKNIGLQIAAAQLGKTAGEICQNGDIACTKVGIKFDTIAGKITLTDKGAQLASDYNHALSVIDGFATNLINFNSTAVAGGYDGTVAGADIRAQFGIISVIEDGDVVRDVDGNITSGTVDTVYEQLVDSANDTNPFTFDSWTGESANADGLDNFIDDLSFELFALNEDGTVTDQVAETVTVKLH